MEIDEKPKTEESSTSVAVEAPPEATVPVEELSDTQRSKWLESGELPKAKETKEDSSTSPKPGKAEVAEKEEPAESAPDGKAPEKVEIPPHEARIKELLAKTKILESEVAKLRQPAPTTVKKEEPAEEQAPKLEDYEDVDKWMAAKVEFEVKQGIRKDRQEREAEENRTRIEAKNTEVVEKWNKSVEAAKKKHADFEDRCFGDDFKIVEGSVLDRWCLESEQGTDVLYHYATNPEEFAKLNQMTPVQAAIEIARTEVKLLEKPKPAPKLVSDAPKPPTEVSGRGTATDDPIAEALASGDMEKYIRLSNEKERAAFSRK